MRKLLFLASNTTSSFISCELKLLDVIDDDRNELNDAIEGCCSYEDQDEVLRYIDEFEIFRKTDSNPYGMFVFDVNKVFGDREEDNEFPINLKGNLRRVTDEEALLFARNGYLFEEDESENNS